MNKLMLKLLGRAVTWNQHPYAVAIVAAAGGSDRMEGEDKLFSELEGIPVIARSLMALQASDYIHEIIVVTREESIVPIADLCAEFEIAKATKMIRGGATRAESVIAGLQEVPKGVEYIAVHDGARPLVTQDVITDAFSKAYNYNAAAPAIPVNDTIKVSSDGFITETPDRSALFAVQTPQVFKAEILKAAFTNAKAAGGDVTDDCSAVERIGVRPALSRGSFENIKITRPIDLEMAALILKGRREG